MAPCKGKTQGKKVVSGGCDVKQTGLGWSLKVEEGARHQRMQMA